MTLIAFILGSLAEYEQNIGLYGSFTTLSSVLGWVGASTAQISLTIVFLSRLSLPVTSPAMSLSGTSWPWSRGGCVAARGRRRRKWSRGHPHSPYLF